ncbi:hypothetical protein BB559_002692 [Furculomyces boomerangus]|uniref:Uncharacterized protein n=1 Tax=Furculomyces boomerangus TaxID=61424 RepID=A0A2T9YT87_9FUNG|nr:hypothetical protein BB559_002692 [Furculomyces boomerangus]
MERVFEKKWASFKRTVLNPKTNTLGEYQRLKKTGLETLQHPTTGGKRPPSAENSELSILKTSSFKHSISLDEQWNNWGKKRKQSPEPQPA